MDKILKYLIIVSLELTFLTILGFCQGAGSSASNGLEFEQMADARAGGMGEAISAVEGDINLIRYNPAGIASLRSSQLSFTYMIGFEDMYFANISCGQPLLFGTIGASFSYFNGGSIELFEGQFINAQSDIVLTLSYSIQIIKGLCLGGSMKFLSSTLLRQTTAQSWASDIGCLYSTPLGLNISFAVQNLGQPLIYYHTPENLPSSIRGGISYIVHLSKDISLSTNIETKYFINDKDLVPSAGIELKYGNMLALRAGYILTTTRGLTFGAGFNFQNYIIDYGFEFTSNIASFGNHRIGLKMEF